MRNQQLTRLLIVSHVRHYNYDGGLFAYGPYAREIEKWAELFPQILIAAPCKYSAPSSDTSKFIHRNISILPVPETGGGNLRAKTKQAFLVPILVLKLIEYMRKADAIHVRCPGNLGLLGVFLAPLFSNFRIAKYASQWNHFPCEPWTWRFQRFLLRSPWWRAPVTVYGQWPNQPAHIVPFFTSIMTDAQMDRARQVSQNRTLHNPLRIMFVGRLSREKNVHVLIQALGLLREIGLSFECKIVGDGSERDTLKALCSALLGMSSPVEFTGALPFDQVLPIYERADVLVLVSETEGWPKAIAEGMAFGLVCVGSDRGFVEQMLSGGRGYVIRPGDHIELANTLMAIASSKRLYTETSQRAAKWSQDFTLNRVAQSLRSLMIQSWDLPEDAFPLIEDEDR